MSCTTTKANLGKSKCNKLPSQFKCMIETPDGFKLAPEDYATSGALKTKLQAALKATLANRVYLWPFFSEFENLSEEAVYQDTPLSLIPVRDGQYRFRFMISKSMELHKAMFTHRSINEGKVLLIDDNNQIFGTEDDDGNIYGFSLAMLHTEKLRFNDGSIPSASPVYVCLGNNEEIDKSGVLIDGSIVSQLERLTDVTMTLVSAVDAGIVVEVKQTWDGTPVSGLVEADFSVLAANGTPQATDGVTEDVNIPGRYTIEPDTAFVTGSVRLVAPSALSLDAYELVAPVEFVIA